MSRVIAFCFSLWMLFVALPAQAWLWGGSDHPSDDEITQWVTSEIPDTFEVLAIEIGLQEVKEAFGMEYSESRVLVTIEPRQPMYRRGDRMSDGTLIAMPVDGDQIEVGFLVEALQEADGWNPRVTNQSAGALRNAGRTLDSFPGALVYGSPEYEAHLAMLEAHEEAERARLEAHEAEVYGNATGEFSGIMVCGRQNVIEIDRVTVDARAGTGQIVFRNAGNEDMRWRTADIDIVRYGDRFVLDNLPGRERSHHNLEIREGGIWHDDRCQVYMHRSEDFPAEIVEQRRIEAQALAMMSPGQIRARLTEGVREREVAVTIIEVFERGFRMALDQPLFSNGSFNNSDERRTNSVIDVRFTDAPAPLVIDGYVDGRGEPAIRRHCAPTAEISEDGTIVFDASGAFACNERLELYP